MPIAQRWQFQTATVAADRVLSLRSPSRRRYLTPVTWGAAPGPAARVRRLAAGVWTHAVRRPEEAGRPVLNWRPAGCRPGGCCRPVRAGPRGTGSVNCTTPATGQQQAHQVGSFKPKFEVVRTPSRRHPAACLPRQAQIENGLDWTIADATSFVIHNSRILYFAFISCKHLGVLEICFSIHERRETDHSRGLFISLLHRARCIHLCKCKQAHMCSD
jgi:hypothetical protein